MAVVNAIGSIIMAIVNGIVTLFDIIIGLVFLHTLLLWGFVADVIFTDVLLVIVVDGVIDREGGILVLFDH